MTVLLLMNLVVLASAFLLTFKFFRFSDFIDSLLAWLVLYFTQIVFTELVLGICGFLRLEYIVAFNLLILLFILIFLRNRNFAFNFNSKGESQGGLLENKVVLFLLSVLIGFTAVKIVINLVNPPFGWDSLNYHFTFAVEWLKNGNLNNPITVSDDPSPTYYPINASLYFFWLMLPLKSVFLADLGQVPFFIMAFLSVFNISRKLNLNRNYSFYAAGLFFIIPNFFKQLEIAYADVMVAGLFLVCLNFLFLLNEKFNLGNVIVFSLSWGLLLGTKTVSLLYSLLLVVPFLYLAFKNYKKSYLIIVAVSVVFIFGGFSYLRNLIQTGNPLYPLDFNLFGRSVFKGVMDNLTYRAHFKVEDYRLSKLLFHEGLGLQTLIFILPGIFLSLPLAFIKNRRGLNFNFIYFLILPFFVYLLYRYVIPLANVRYLYLVLGVGMVSGFYVAKLLGISSRTINILVVLSVLASMPELAERGELFAAVLLTIAIFIAISFERAFLKNKVFITFSLVLVLFLSFYLEKDYKKNEYPRYIKMVKYSGFWPEVAYAWNWLNDNTDFANIAYIGRPVPFPLYGSSFKNNVYYVSVNRTEPAKLHYFSGSRYEWGHDFLSEHKNLEAPGNYRFGADYSLWLNNLLRKNTDYLFIYSLHQTENLEFPLEDRWARLNPSRFKAVFNNETVHIYGIIK